MAVEIERKFLVRSTFEKYATGEVRIKQFYLSVDPGRIVRIRIMGERAMLTVKSAIPDFSFARMEMEYEIPVKDAEEMMRIAVPGVIDKTRYYVPSGKHVFEVDVFHDKNEGLILAEIELSSETEDFEKPEWLGEEVTGNPAFYNSNLIK